MTDKTLSQWLQWLESLRLVRTAPEALKTLRDIAERLELLPLDIPVITVGGTNGKGSCVALLESIYKTAGYRVGAFTSPHLIRFNERIRVDQMEVSNEQICEAFSQIDRARGDLSLNYFQFSFLAALMIFKRLDLDLVVLEVGIGGRYDAVNMIDPEVSIIASVDLDHCAVLGNTREIIGRDKAGIMRPGKPVVCGDLNPPKSIYEEAKKIGARLYCQQRDFEFSAEEDVWHWEGPHQEQYNALPRPSSIALLNASTVLMAIMCLQPQFPITMADLKQGLERVQIRGRGQLVSLPLAKVRKAGESDNIEILFDVAHNPAAANLLSQQLDRLKPRGRVYAVIGMLQDKDIAGVLHYFDQKIDHWFITKLPDPRSADPEAIAARLPSVSSQCTCYLEPVLAFQSALKQANPNDLILVFGSFVLVGELLSFAHATSIV